MKDKTKQTIGVWVGIGAFIWGVICVISVMVFLINVGFGIWSLLIGAFIAPVLGLLITLLISFLSDRFDIYF
jgi:hypothetical protein